MPTASVPATSHFILTCSVLVPPWASGRQCVKLRGSSGEASCTHKPCAALKQTRCRATAPKAESCLALSHHYPDSPETPLSPRQKDRLLCQEERLPRTISPANNRANVLNTFTLFVTGSMGQGLWAAWRRGGFKMGRKKIKGTFAYDQERGKRNKTYFAL